MGRGLGCACPRLGARMDRRLEHRHLSSQEVHYVRVPIGVSAVHACRLWVVHAKKLRQSIPGLATRATGEVQGPRWECLRQNHLIMTHEVALRLR